MRLGMCGLPDGIDSIALAVPDHDAVVVLVDPAITDPRRRREAIDQALARFAAAA